MRAVRRLRNFVVLGGVMAAIPLSLGAGVASADPITAALVNTTCSYGQITGA